MSNPETDLQQRIRLALGTLQGLRLFRNQTGQLPDPKTGRPVQFGLARGSADLIGWRTVTVTPDMVGTRLAVFTSIEVKTATGRLTPQQRNWLEAVRLAGGIAGVARSVADALQITSNPPHCPNHLPTSGGP
ncbi:MAG: VRR-NUC domain-containing protein [Cyanobium sp.]|nr:VRR-NUC domain-containing protein [Cyanobium sp.]